MLLFMFLFLLLPSHHGLTGAACSVNVSRKTIFSETLQVNVIKQFRHLLQLYLFHLAADRAYLQTFTVGITCLVTHSVLQAQANDQP